MLLEIGLIVGGVPAGWLFRRSENVVRIVNKTLAGTVHIMLFLLGLALGLDDVLLGQWKKLGLYAAAISTFSVAGCLAAAWLLGTFVFPEYAPGRNNTDVSSKRAYAGSFSALIFFLFGVAAGWFRFFSEGFAAADTAVWVLWGLLFLAGMTVGFDLRALTVIRDMKCRILIIPLGVVIGTLFGSFLAWLLLLHFFEAKLIESLAVGAGFGYYSLAAVIMTRLGDPMLGSVALLSNMMHEALALILPPFLVRFTGILGPVLAGGAAAMDTCLPVIASVSGKRGATLAVFSGMCLTLSVPFIIPFLMILR